MRLPVQLTARSHAWTLLAVAAAGALITTTAATRHAMPSSADALVALPQDANAGLAPSGQRQVEPGEPTPAHHGPVTRPTRAHTTPRASASVISRVAPPPPPPSSLVPPPVSATTALPRSTSTPPGTTTSSTSARTATTSPSPVRSVAPPPGSSYPEQASADTWLFNKINAERKAAGRGPLLWDGRLNSSARAHNIRMAQADTLSHQLSGEAPMGQRIAAAGVVSSYEGENIGYTTDCTNGGVSAATAINNGMMSEGPGGGHYENLMSTKFTHVGVSVVYDPVHQKMWITEDFAAE